MYLERCIVYTGENTVILMMNPSKRLIVVVLEEVIKAYSVFYFSLLRMSVSKDRGLLSKKHLQPC